MHIDASGCLWPGRLAEWGAGGGVAEFTPKTGSLAWWLDPGGWRGASAGKGPGGLRRAGSRLPRLATEEVPETLPPAWEKARVRAAGGPGEPGSVRGQQEGSGE